MAFNEQEKFWAGDFGDDYQGRNESDGLLASNLHFFSKALKAVGKVSSCVEIGANIGMNMKALKLLYPGIFLQGIEINESAAKRLEGVIGAENVFHSSILEAKTEKKAQLTLSKGVLIHMNPDTLNDVYEKLYSLSEKYILIGEYYNPAPVAIPYRGHSDKLFKRDFAGEMLDKYADLELVDYGFAYRRDKAFPQDDISWFLLQKTGGK